MCHRRSYCSIAVSCIFSRLELVGHFCLACCTYLMDGQTDKQTDRPFVRTYVLNLLRTNQSKSWDTIGSRPFSLVSCLYYGCLGCRLLLDRKRKILSSGGRESLVCVSKNCPLTALDTMQDAPRLVGHLCRSYRDAGVDQVHVKLFTTASSNFCFNSGECKTRLFISSWEIWAS